MHDEAEVGLVVAHARARSCDDRLQVVGQQPLLSLNKLVGLDLSAVDLADRIRRLPLGRELGTALRVGVILHQQLQSAATPAGNR